MDPILVIGAGLAGSEAAWQIAQAGLAVRLFEMRPQRPTAAHATAEFAELVCSNSLGSKLEDRAGGVLQAELRALDCLLLQIAERHAVPAGGALAVDRTAFAQEVTRTMEEHPRIEVVRKEVMAIPETGIVILASGPLTSEALAKDMARVAGQEHLFFFDALAPVVVGDTLDRSIIFRASRRQDGAGDYLNIPLNREEYEGLVDGLLDAEGHVPRPFEAQDPRGKAFFERCLPVEILAARGRESLRFGPLRPVGLRDPRTGERPWAVIQLRTENHDGTLWNLVGFQTHLKHGAQEKLLRNLPGMAQAEFARLGSMHRNTFLRSPVLLTSGLEWRCRTGLFAAGQITGMEGYLGNVGSGLLAGRNAVRRALDKDPEYLPTDTLLGALANHVATAPPAHYQPMKAEFGLLPPPPRLSGRSSRSQRRMHHAQRSADSMARHLAEHPLPTTTSGPIPC